MYAIYGIAVPVNDADQANSLINELANLHISKLDLGDSYSLCGVQEIEDIEIFGSDLQEFLEKYTKE
jgi:hypothetical protein